MFEWGRPHSFLAKRQHPYEWQSEILQDCTTRLQEDPSIYRLAIASGKGIGKTALLAMVFLWHVMTHRHSQTNLLGVTGDSIDQRVWSEIARWFYVCKLRPYFRRYKGGRVVHNYHDEWQGAYQLWSPGHLEALHGSHAEYLGYFVDEASGLPDTVLQTIESGAVDEHVFLAYFSNPTRLRSRFRQCFDGGTLARLWQHWQIDSRTTERHNPARVQELLDEADGDEDNLWFRINVRGLFPLRDSEQFITDDMVALAQQRQVTPDPKRAIAVGVDVARMGSNKTVFIARQGPCIVAKHSYSKQEIDQSAKDLMTFLDILAIHFPGVPIQAYIDIIGYGAGVHDICKTAGYAVHEVNSALPARGPHRKQYDNRRMELWAFMKDWLCREGSLSPTEKTLAAQLVAPSASITPKGQFILESKDAMQARGVASPDEADALSYTFAGDQDLPLLDMSLALTGTWKPSIASQVGGETSRQRFHERFTGGQFEDEDW